LRFSSGGPFLTDIAPSFGVRSASQFAEYCIPDTEFTLIKERALAEGDAPFL
jgi:hypothetical protein